MEKRKFNIIDFILIIVIAAAAALLVYILLGNNIFSGSEETTIVYTLEMRLVRNEFIPSLLKMVPGTEMIDSVRNHDIGKIIEVTIEDAYENEADLITGVVNRVPYPDHSIVRIKVKAEAEKDEFGKYTVSGMIFMVGIPINFRTTHFVGLGRCVYLIETGEENGESKESNESANGNGNGNKNGEEE